MEALAFEELSLGFLFIVSFPALCLALVSTQTGDVIGPQPR